MLAVVLAAQAVCGVHLFLQPQDHVADVAWPTHAFVTLPQGWVKSTDQLAILENGKPIVSQIEVAAKWPDGSPKWLHAHASFRYVGGKPAKYELDKFAKLPAGIPQSPLKVSDKPDGIEIDTGRVKFLVPRPFAGITSAESGGQQLLGGPGGPSLIDERGIVWKALHDTEAEVVVEQQGPAQVTIKASGWYQTAEKRAAPFCRFVTRITACADSALVKFDHATIFADDMRQHAISELAFDFAVPKVQGYTSPSGSGGFDGKLAAIYFAQLSANGLFTIAQPPGEEPRVPAFTAAKGHSPGWYSANLADRRVTLLTKDFWQKYPKEVKVSPAGLTYYAWPRHNELAAPDKTALKLEGIYKFQCFHTGKLLDSRLPNDYFAALSAQTDTGECRAEYARASNLEGVAMHNEFAMLFPTAADAEPKKAGDHLGRLQKLYSQSPIARVSPEAVAASGVLGPVAAFGKTFLEAWRTVHDGMLGYGHSIERYGDYGWAIYGNTHSEEIMNNEAAGVTGGRPSLHRVWNNNHYQHVSTSWRLGALHGDPKLWEWARICTDNYSSVGQVRYDAGKGRIDGNNVHHPGPEVKYHNPGAFWHCKALVPWGGRNFGMDSNDDDSGLAGHWADPSSLLYAWLFDANRWAKDGYELWLANVKFPTGGTRREINTSIVHAITAYEYQPKQETLMAIKGMAQGLISVPLEAQRPGPIWEPTWLSRYHELVPNDEAFNKYIVTSADSIGLGIEGVHALALSAAAYRITKDDKYLRRHAGTLGRVARQPFYDPAPDKRWDRYGFAPGPDRDGHFMLQWPWFCGALKEANIDTLPPPEEPGHFLSSNCRFENLKDIQARGTKILVWNEKGTEFPLKFEATTIRGGDIGATSLHVFAPGGDETLAVERLQLSDASKPNKRITRPSSWEVLTETHTVPAKSAGMYKVFFGGGAGVFQPITDLPSCQVLYNRKISTWYEETFFTAKLTHGYLVPLTKGKIKLEFTALGVCDGSYVSLYGAKKQPLLVRYLRSGDSVSITLNDAQHGPGPWLLDTFCDHSGFFKLVITSDVDEPLLYGRNIDEIELIRKKLGK